MLQPLRQAARRQSKSTSIPAPIGGWNARDAVDMMPETDAIYLINYLPDQSYVGLRRGNAEHATGLDDWVASLMPYNGVSTEKLFSASGTKISDVTSAGAVGAAAVTGLSNDEFQHVNFGTGSDNYLWICNGADAPHHYDGTTWALPSLTISGFNATDIINCAVFKNRIFVVFKNSLTFGYLPLSSIAGAVGLFPLDGEFSLGGSLVAVATWSRNGGAGPDDYIAFITDQGQCAVYAGTDPSNASAFGIVNTFFIGRPIGRRCVQKLGADLIVITEAGAVRLGAVLPTDGQAPQVAVSDKISPAWSEAVQNYGNNDGWEMAVYPRGRYMLFNIPVSSTVYHQYVANLVTGNWCKFTGQDARCWAIHKGELYFGGNTKVMKADTGFSDNGAAINGAGKTAFQYLRSRGQLKDFTMIRPVMASNGSLAVSLGIDTDFADGIDVFQPSTVNTTGATWDEADWDVAEWAPENTPVQSWRTVSGNGYCMSARIRTATMAQSVRWHATDIMWIPATGI